MTPPGWYENPSDPSSLRWWDGKAWSQATTPRPPEPAASLPPVGSPAALGPQFSPAPAATSPTPGRAPLLIAIGVAIVLVVGAAAAFFFISSSSSTDAQADFPPAQFAPGVLEADELLLDPLVVEVDKRYMDAFEQADFSFDWTETGDEPLEVHFDQVGQFRRLSYTDSLFPSVWISDGTVTCTREVNTTVPDTHEADLEAYWYCADPGKDFWSDDLEQFAKTAPLALLRAGGTFYTPSWDEDQSRLTFTLSTDDGSPNGSLSWEFKDSGVVFEDVFPEGFSDKTHTLVLTNGATQEPLVIKDLKTVYE